MDGFRNLALDKAEVEYRYGGDTVNLTMIDLVSRDLLRVEGRADIKAGHIDGKFFVGVTPATLKWLPGAHKRVFTMQRPEPENVGYAWTTMNVKGPLTAPRDDLSARLLEAAGLAILDAPGEAVKTITGGESELINGGVEAGSDLIESGVDTLKGFLPMFGP